VKGSGLIPDLLFLYGFLIRKLLFIKFLQRINRSELIIKYAVIHRFSEKLILLQYSCQAVEK